MTARRQPNWRRAAERTDRDEPVVEPEEVEAGLDDRLSVALAGVNVNQMTPTDGLQPTAATIVVSTTTGENPVVNQLGPGADDERGRGDAAEP